MQQIERVGEELNAMAAASAVSDQTPRLGGTGERNAQILENAVIGGLREDRQTFGGYEALVRPSRPRTMSN
ncbi:MAG: hypothetical protein HC888_13355 [Candidatus Competibacteraceae bacterium]|nr:hypothetical protein [Candidatus Competibacteraceae bacterium]